VDLYRINLSHLVFVSYGAAIMAFMSFLDHVIILNPFIFIKIPDHQLIIQGDVKITSPLRRHWPVSTLPGSVVTL
jgi:hypothetical protein